jgi:PhnB protein
MDGPGDTIGHAEIMIGDSHIMLSDESPQMGARGPLTLGGSAVGILLYVDDVDAMAKRAVDAGAKVVRPVEDQFYGDRAGSFEDPFGHQWFIPRTSRTSRRRRWRSGRRRWPDSRRSEFSAVSCRLCGDHS